MLLLCLLSVLPAAAHANLASADPAPNTRLTASPDALHLTFTEPVEPAFIQLDMRASDGQSYAAAPATASADSFTITLPLLPDLPDGVYSVDWRVVSASDGHPTRGSYPLIIGTATTTAIRLTPVEAPISIGGALARTLNLTALALLAGVPLFTALVWYPAARRAGLAAFDGNARLWRLSWVAWALAGLAAIVMLAAQTETLTGAITLNNMAEVTFATRYGTLWLIRAGVWTAFGVALLFLPGRAGLQIMLAAAVLLMQALYSHAAGAETNAAAYIAADLLHLLGAAAWIGGLCGLIAVYPAFRGLPVALGSLVARFSTIARLAVASLVVTGVIAGLLHIGSIAGLLTTDYGIALLVKLALFAPTLILAAVNLLVTERRLRAGQAVWTGRLRGLVTVEIGLLAGALAAAGVMTSSAPAHVLLTARAQAAAQAAPAASAPLFEMVEADDLMAHLIIDPGVVGENTFTVEVYHAADLTPVTDATLIRMRFRQGAGGSESELRPTHVGEGRYTVTGANLSAPGDWRVRVTISRPAAFDTVMDFHPDLATDTPSPTPDAPVTPTPLANGTASGGLFRVVSTHGYWFLLGWPIIPRIGQGGREQGLRLLTTPDGSFSRDLVMLADHSHALLTGREVYRTGSLGLGWRALDAPAPIEAIAADADDHLLAYSGGTVYIFDPFSATWDRPASE